MAQPSQMERPNRVVSGRLSAAQFLSLEQELTDRGLNRSTLVADLVLAWLRAVTGRGHRCHCPDCPGNMATIRRTAGVQPSLWLDDAYSA
jgi:hypothetical protein